MQVAPGSKRTAWVVGLKTLRIHAAASAPLPAAVFGRQVANYQLGPEAAFAPAPVDDQILHQIGGHDHEAAVVHPAAFVQLAHRRDDDRHAGEPLAPGLEPGRVVLPGKWRDWGR